LKALLVVQLYATAQRSQAREQRPRSEPECLAGHFHRPGCREQARVDERDEVRPHAALPVRPDG